jgi:hypothetical protein
LEGVGKGSGRGSKGVSIPFLSDSDSDSDSDTDSDTESKNKITAKAEPHINGKGNHIAKWVDLHRELWDEDFTITPVLVGQITNTYKALKKDMDEFETRVRNFLNDPWVRENRPGPDYFYRNINKYAKTPAKVVKPYHERND